MFMGGFCMKSLWALVLILSLAIAPIGKASTDDPYKITVTTTFIADAVRQIIPTEGVELTALMGPGVDPHLYRATQGDIGRLLEADLILYHGMFLEGKMAETLERMAKRKAVISVTEKIDRQLLIPLVDNETFEVDPHLWFDVSLWSKVVQNISQILSDRLPQKMRPVIEQNTREYLHELAQLHEWIGSQIETVPELQRVLITAHDAFAYFSRAYKIEVRALQGVSTASEFGLQDMRQLSDFIVNRSVPAIFVESSVPRRFIESLQAGARAKGAEVAIGGELYSDALGSLDSPEGTYVGAVAANVAAIVEALGGRFKPFN
jgi:manganese/zinc/iron transport system substrate-binding protein